MSPYAVLFVLFGVLSFGFYAYREQDRDVPIHVVKTIKLPIPHRER